MEGKASIRDMVVSAEWIPLEQAGILDIRMAIADDRESVADRVFVRAVVQTPDGEFLTTGASRLISPVPFTSPGTWCPVRLCRQIQGAAFWSPEAPHWYGLLVMLEDGHGHVLDVVSGKFGFPRPDPCAATEAPPGHESLAHADR